GERPMTDSMDLRRAARWLVLAGLLALAGCASAGVGSLGTAPSQGPMPSEYEVHSLGPLLTHLSPFRSETETIAALYGEGRYGGVIARLQPRLDAGQPLSSYYLWLLTGSHYEMRQYRPALAPADAMDRRIMAGDRILVGNDLSPYPPIYRASVALDLGAYEDAVRHGTEALARIKAAPRPGLFDPSFEGSQLIQIYPVLG